MKKILTSLLLLVLLGGCSSGVTQQKEPATPEPSSNEESVTEIKEETPASTHTYNPQNEPGGDIFHITFKFPEEWSVEYIPTIEALNLYTSEGSGSNLERSQILIRYFDADSFLTLNTVTIHATEDLTIGAENYTSRRYDIEKNPDIPNFPNQPSWRNERHTVTDFRAREGFTRYFVVAANPRLETAIYESVLQSVSILQ